MSKEPRLSDEVEMRRRSVHNILKSMGSDFTQMSRQSNPSRKRGKGGK